MNNETIQEQVKQIMSGLFSLDAINIDGNSSIKTVERWDSLQHVNLMMALEQEFDIQIDVVDAIEMTSFPAICKTLACYLGDAE